MTKLKGNKARIAMTGVLLGVGVSIILFIIAVTGLGLVINFSDIANGSVDKIMIVSNYLALFIGGLIAAYSAKSKGWLNGGLVGLIYVLLLILLGSFTTVMAFSGGLLLRMTIACVVSALGGIIGINII